MLKRQTTRAAAAAVTLAVAAVASANDLYWQGTDGSVDSPNYFDATTSTAGVGVGGSDSLYIGAGSTLTEVSNLTSGRLIVGHNGSSTPGATTTTGVGAGAGTVAITGGTFSITAGSSTTVTGYTTSPNAGLIVGASGNGSLSITNSTVNVNDTAIVGMSLTDTTINASLAVNAGGTLNVLANNLSLGANGTSTVAGAGGSMTVAGGTVSISGSGADLEIGTWNKSSFTQTGGITTVADQTYVGRRNADFSTFTLSGGTFNTRVFNIAETSGSGRPDDVTATVTNNAVLNITSGLNIGTGNGRRTKLTVDGTAAVNSGTLTIGGTGSVTTTVTFTGSSTLTGTGGLNLGNDTSNVSSVTFSGNTAVNLNNGLTVGLGPSTNNTITVKDNATINLARSGASNVHFFLGRGTSTGTVFNMSGGALNVPNYVLIGTTDVGSTGTTVTNHSGGTITAGTNLTPTGPDVPPVVRVGFKVGDTGGVHTYNLSGTGVINVANGLMIVGRQGSTATFNQTGGTVTANGGLRVGDAETATATFQTATGTYVLSGGTINASVPTGSSAPALAVGYQDTGTLRIVGGDATVNVTGNVLVNTGAAVDPTPARVGTLAYKLETGEGLTKINATGTATFSAASVLSLDLNGVASPASSYDLITATDVINNGLTLSVPAGWHMDLVDGATTKTLQFVNAINGDANRNGKIDADDYALLDRGAAQQAKWWHNGDFNDSGVIDSQDYLIIDTALGLQGGHLSPEFLALRESQFGAGYVADLVAAVPEPGTLSVLAAGVLPLLGRRRRSR